MPAEAYSFVGNFLEIGAENCGFRERPSTKHLNLVLHPRSAGFGGLRPLWKAENPALRIGSERVARTPRSARSSAVAGQLSEKALGRDADEPYAVVVALASRGFGGSVGLNLEQAGLFRGPFCT